MSIVLTNYEIDPVRGFLPAADPCQNLPLQFIAWEEAAKQLPKLLVTDRIRTIFDDLPDLDPSLLQTRAEQERAMMLLSYIGHAYVWGEPEPATSLPPPIARPWYAISQTLGRPPVLSYASYALSNWRRVDSKQPIHLGNIALLQNFLAGVDEEWFILVHVDIEQRAAAAISAIPTLLDAASSGQLDQVIAQLTAMGDALDEMNLVMERMPEHCDPYIYYNRVRPYIHGWKDQPRLPDGVMYEGVAAYGGQPQQFRGETGAQSSIVPSFDAALGVSHRDDPLKRYLDEMRDYMTPRHRAFIEAVETTSTVREYVSKHHSAEPRLKEMYNRCIEGVTRFRTTHLGYASDYINKQRQTSSANPTQVGTGGTPFMDYLKKHRDETSQFLIS